jgi:3',5'-cyclic AMP phosphodiesterase CpdA
MAEEKPDFVFVTGDMCMNGPKVPEDLKFARAQMERLPVPWRAIPGNHDIGDTPPDTRLKGPITRSRRAAYRKAFGDDFWVQDLGDWRFIGLNAQLMDSGLPGETAQMGMVTDALGSAATRQCAILIHKPLYNKSATERGQSLQALWPKSRKRLLALCEKHKVKLVASGHCGTAAPAWSGPPPRPSSIPERQTRGSASPAASATSAIPSTAQR